MAGGEGAFVEDRGADAREITEEPVGYAYSEEKGGLEAHTHTSFK